MFAQVSSDVLESGGVTAVVGYQGALQVKMAGLTHRERQIIYFHYFHQVGFDEIAGLLAVSKGASRNYTSERWT